MYKKIVQLLLEVFVSVFFVSLWTGMLIQLGEKANQKERINITSEYREQNIGEEMCQYIQGKKEASEFVSAYLMETKFGYEEWEHKYTDDVFRKLVKQYAKQKEWDAYVTFTRTIWEDVEYFPVSEFSNHNEWTVSYVNSWMAERNYGGKSGHEGTDIIATKNKRGLYPIVSMTDGTVTKKGWLEKGGYRIGITTEKGAYFYYAHLESYADLEIGDTVKAGDILGFMGDSGYGPEGTVGQFVVHLHLGIYIYPDGKEISINPYWVLRYIENRTVKCYTEI